MESITPLINKVYWPEVRAKIKNAEPALTKIIDKLAPNKDYPLIRVLYPFGSLIFANLILHLPSTGYHSTPITSSELSIKLQNCLNYSSLPLGCAVENHGLEIYQELDDNFHPIDFHPNGLHIGPLEFFDLPSSFSISAGARSLVMLPKISDTSSHNRLKAFGVEASNPSKPFDLWQICRELANHPGFATPWFCEVIYFTNSWAEKIRHDPAWLPFKYFVLQRVWENIEFSRHRFAHDEMWESFFHTLSARKIKPVSYITDFFKYLIYAAATPTLAFKPIGGNQTAGPIDEILKIYLDVYKLKNYFPTLMALNHFSAPGNDPFYCSLHVSTFWNSIPNSRDSISLLRDLEHLIWLMGTFQRELEKGILLVNKPKILRLFDEVNFEFFHDTKSGNSQIKPSRCMPDNDAKLLYLPSDADYGVRKFSEKSTFVRGCVRISKKKVNTAAT